MATLPAAATEPATALTDALQAVAATDRLDLQAIGRLYDAAVLDANGVGGVIEWLRVFADDAGRSEHQRVNTLLAVAHMHWQHGDLAAAVEAADAALARRETTDGLLLKARLLDAAGDAAAAAWYERVGADAKRVEEREFVAIRLTMAQATAHNVDVLVALASERDQNFRNRAAIALAVLGHPHEALALYRVTAAFGTEFRQRARMTDWALASSAADRAKTLAWQAFEAAGPRADRLYALALLTEAYREDNALDALLSRLEAADPVDPELVQTRIDALVETARYDEAIAFYQTTADTDAAGVEDTARRRLLGLYQAAGRDADMVAEYRRLMAVEPHTVHWYAGLAMYYVNSAAPADALAVWRTLEAANGDAPDVLLAAAERMGEMGFGTQAIAMIERQMAQAGEYAAGLLFLFNAHLERGRSDDAAAILERLEAILPADDSAIRDLADAYERMNRPHDALRLFEALQAQQGQLGYDEQARLAWLYGAAGRKHDALRVWRTLWARIANPARRRLAEDQLLLLAAELNQLADIVIEIEEKLAAGRASERETNLLVRIYTDVGDSFSATEVVDEFARRDTGDEVARLRQLGKVYMQLGDHAAYGKVLRQLIAADPDHAIEHMQNLLLNMLSYDVEPDSNKRFEEIQHWLGRLRSLDVAGASGEFEAGVLALAGFADAAIESYRRALVLQPDNSDNLLLMADLMHRGGRRDEALAILQYAAEHATDDNAFVVAVDGIVNLIGARSFNERLTSAMRTTLRWTQRIILERITSRNDKFYLYQLLADIAQELGDAEGEFLALENALSQAGVRRPAILRELVTRATPNTGFGGFDTGGGDRRRQLIHGRRLIGLRQALPPNVYIDLGKVLLEYGDLAGAERVFDGIDDITGTIDIDKTKADLLHEAGDPNQALAYYARALSVKPHDLTLLTQTALLREARGQDAVANRLYLRGVDDLLRRQPATSKAQRTQDGFADATTTRDYNAYFEALAQGLLITWPEDSTAAAQRLEAVRTLFDEALDAVGRTPGEQPLAQFPRLHRTADFARRVARFTDSTQLAEYVDSALGDFEEESDRTASINGLQQPLLARHLARAKEQGDFGTVVRIAQLLDDERTLAELFGQRIAAGEFRQAIASAWEALQPATFKRLLAPFAPTLKDNAQAFLELIGGGAERVLEIEQLLGRQLITADELVGLLNGPVGKAFLDARDPSGRGTELWRYFQSKVGVEGWIRYLATIAEGRQQDAYSMRAASFMVVYGDLLRTTLTAAQRDAVVQAVGVYVAQVDLAGEHARSEIQRLLLRDVAAANLRVLYAVAELCVRRGQLDIDLVEALRTVYAGAPEDGFDTLLDLRRNGYFDPSLADGGAFADRFAAQRAKVLARMRLGQPVDLAKAEAVYEMEFPRFGFSGSLEERSRRMAEALPHYIALDPEEPRYRHALVIANLDLGEYAAAEQALLAYHAFQPEDEMLRGAVYFHWLNEGRFADALALVADGGPDFRDDSVLDALLDKAQGPTVPESSARIFQRFYKTPLQGFNPWSKAMQQGIERLRALVAQADEDPRSVRRALRAVWRTALTPADGGGNSDRRLDLLLRLPLSAASAVSSSPHDLGAVVEPKDGRQPALLFDALAETAATATEFERFVPALPADQRRGRQQLYDILTRALEAAELSRQRFDELTDKLRRGTLDDHDFILWMALRDRRNAPLDDEQFERFQARAAHILHPTAFEVLLMARTFAARADALATSAEHYQLLAATLVQRRDAAPLMDLSALAADIAERLPRDVALPVIRSVFAVAHGGDDDPAAVACQRAYAMKTLSMLLPTDDVLAETHDAGDSAVNKPGLCAVAAAVETVRIHAMASDFDRALAVLRDLLPLMSGGQGDYWQQRREQHLMRLYGLQTATWERIYPARREHEWQGSNDWIERAATIAPDWLDASDISAATALQASLAAIWQWRSFGADDAAQRAFARLAEKIAVSGAASTQALRLLAITANRLDCPLPLELAAQALSHGILGAEQEAGLLRQLAQGDKAQAALRIGRAADRGDRLAVMRALRLLADAADAPDYASDLGRRIHMAEQARQALGLVEYAAKAR